LGAIRGAGGVEVAGVYDQDRSRAETRAGEFGVERVYGSWREVLDDSMAAVVAVLLPHDLHCRFAVEALQAGHHVVCEKPLATSIAECDEMLAAAARAGKQLRPVHNRVYEAGAEAAQEFVASGAIGTVFLAQTIGLEPPQTVSVRPWLGTPAGGGGVLIAQAVHPAYVLRWVLGDDAEVACFTSEQKVVEMTAEDTAVVMLRFRCGAIGEMTGTFGLSAGPYAHGVTFYGPQGYVEIGPRQEVAAISPARFGDREVHRLAENRGTGHAFQRMWEDYARGLATGAATRVTAEDGKRAVEVILAAYRSAAERRPISLPLA
jgi:predicted dehydrogenase